MPIDSAAGPMIILTLAFGIPFMIAVARDAGWAILILPAIFIAGLIWELL